MCVNLLYYNSIKINPSCSTKFFVQLAFFLNKKLENKVNEKTQITIDNLFLFKIYNRA